MQKKKIIQNVSYMLIFGVLIKTIAFFYKIYLTRSLGFEGLSIYTYLMPTLSLFLSIAQFGFPLSISKVISQSIAKKPYSNRSMMQKCILTSLLLTILLFSILFIFIDTYTEKWLRAPNTRPYFIYLFPLVFLASCTGILKGYFNGYQHLKEPLVANLIEEVTNSGLVIFLLFFNSFDALTKLKIALLGMSFGELCSFIYLTIRTSHMTTILPIKLEKEDTYQKVLDISVPLTLTRLAGSISYFFEPLIFTFSLRNIVDQKTIQFIYGSINGYAMPLLLLMNFITYSLSNYFLPIITEYKSKNKMIELKKLFSTGLRLSILFGGISTIIMFFYPYEIMSLVFSTIQGAKYVKYMAIPFFFFYFEHILIALLYAYDLSKRLLKWNILWNLIKLGLIYILCSNPIFLGNGLCISFIVSILLVVGTYSIYAYKKVGFVLRPKWIFMGILFAFCLYLLGNELKKTDLNFIFQGLILILLFLIFMTFSFYSNHKENKQAQSIQNHDVH